MLSGKHTIQVTKQFIFPCLQQNPRMRTALRINANVGICHRSFLTRAYPTMKKNNPYTPIMIREAKGIEPRVYARYEFGREKLVDLRGMCTLPPRLMERDWGVVCELRR